MPVSYKHKLIFIHIPKTAGTSIEFMLDIPEIDAESMYYSKGTSKISKDTFNKIMTSSFNEEERTICASKNMQHYTYKELYKLLDKETIESFKKITVVRNPYERLVSEYNYRCEFCNQPAFEKFVVDGLSLDVVERNKKYDGHLETQTSFLLNEDGNLNSIDKIYYFENIRECIKDIQNLTSNKTYAHLRKSINKRSFDSYYSTPGLKDFVYNFYKEDFINFNYTR